MSSVINKTFIGILLLLVAFGFATYFSGALGDATLGVTLKTNLELNENLLVHYSFDGDFEQGTFEFASGGATTTDPTGGDDFARAIATDSSGYVYVTGECNGCGSFGSQAIYTQKIDPLNGSVVWSTTTDAASGSDRAYGVAVDSNDDVYVASYCILCGTQGTIVMHTFKIDSSDGSMLWGTTTNPSTSSNYPTGITVDTADNVLVSGYCDGCGTYGNDAYYIFKIDSADGSMVWSTTTDPTSSDDQANAVAVDDSGDLYVTGYCTGCGAVGNGAHYTIKVDGSDGSMLWATSTDVSSTFEEASGITVDGDYVYVASEIDPSDDEHFIYKLNTSDGTAVWSIINDPSGSDEQPSSITTDSDGDVYVGGYCAGCGSQGDRAFYTYKLDDADGSVLWSTTTDPTSGLDTTYGISNFEDALFVIGECAGCGSNGNDASYLLKLNTSDGAMFNSGTDGAIQNVGANRSSGNIGQGIELSGGHQFVAASSSAIAALENDFTVAAWVYRNTSADGAIIAASRESDNSSFGLRLTNADDIHFVTFGVNDYFSTGFDVPVGIWTHVAVVLDENNNANFYLDGEFMGAGQDSASAGNKHEGRYLIGAFTDQGFAEPNNVLDGKLDDIRIYNTSLSTSTIKRLYQLGATTKVNKTLDTNPDLKDGLTGHWTFDGVLETQIADSSTNGYSAYFDAANATNTMITPGVIGQGLTTPSLTQGIDVLDGWGHFAENFTISVWFKHSGLQNTYSSIVSTYDNNPGNSVGVFINTFGTSPTVDITVDPDVLSHSTGVLDDEYFKQWQNYTFTRNTSGSGELYYNGELATTTDQFPTGTYTLTNNDYFRLGGDFDAGFPGSIDDVRTYDRVLSAAEIRRLYELGATTKINKTITTNPDLENGMIGYWSFDGAGTYSVVSDLSNTSNDGYILEVSTSSALSPGKTGQAVSFDVDGGYVETDLSKSELVSTDISYAAWFKIEEYTSDERTILGMEGSSNTLRVNTDGSISYWTESSGSDRKQTAAGVVNLNTWHHLTLVYDDSADDADIYLDGVIIPNSQDDDVLTDLASQSNRLMLGQRPDGPHDQLIGALDDVRVYTRTLTQDEITRLYQLGN